MCQTVRRYAHGFVTKDSKDVRKHVGIYFRRCVGIDVRTRIREIGTNGFTIGFTVVSEYSCPGGDHNHSSCVLLFIIWLVPL